jgi:predicted ATPase
MARRALDLWNGSALAEFAHDPWFVPVAAGLEELRANIVDIAAEALVASGRAGEAVELLEPATRSHPLREPSHVLLMDALRVSGRNADALRVAGRYRRYLRDETGLAPGAALAAAEQRALAGDEANAVPRRPVAARPGGCGPLGAGLPRVTRLIGRDAELHSLTRSLAVSRLVTICGPGGVGKTRLAAELADRTASAMPVVSVPLAPVQTGEVAAAVAAALNLRGDGASAVAIAEHLCSTSAVVIIDNAEHVAAEVAEFVRTLLDGAPGVRILVTSRARLELADERVHVLAPLSVEGARAPAVELFLERLDRAGRAPVDQSDADVRHVCARLDGLPLALELAAGRAAVLGVAGLRDRLESALDLVATSSNGHRHSSLRRVVSWSYDLLDEPSRRLLAALAVFDGEFDLDAAEHVGAAVVGRPVSLLLARLVDASLVAAGGTGRYRLLDMVRQFGREQVTAGEGSASARRAHIQWVATRLASIGQIVGPAEHQLSARLDELRDEVRGAIRWAGAVGDRKAATTLVVPLAQAFQYRPDAELIRAGYSVVRQLLGSGSAREQPSAGLTAAGARLALHAGRLDDVPGLVTAALLTSGDDRAARHRARHAEGVLHLYHGRPDAAATAFATALEEAATVIERLDALAGLGLAVCYAGPVVEGRPIVDELRAIAETMGSATYCAFADYIDGELHLAGGAVDAAVGYLRAATERAGAVGASFVSGIAATVLAGVVVRHRPPPEARAQLLHLLEVWRSTANWTQLWTTLRLTAEFLAVHDRHDLAALILAAAERDRAAPRVVGDDLVRLTDVAARLRHRLGEAAYGGITAGAAGIERMELLDRVVDALERLDYS